MSNDDLWALAALVWLIVLIIAPWLYERFGGGSNGANHRR